MQSAISQEFYAWNTFNFVHFHFVFLELRLNAISLIIKALSIEKVLSVILRLTFDNILNKYILILNFLFLFRA